MLKTLALKNGLESTPAKSTAHPFLHLFGIEPPIFKHPFMTVFNSCTSETSQLFQYYFILKQLGHNTKLSPFCQYTSYKCLSDSQGLIFSSILESE